MHIKTFNVRTLKNPRQYPLVHSSPKETVTLLYHYSRDGLLSHH